MNSNEFIKKMKEYFITNDKEWVKINITPLNKIDIRLVSDKSENVFAADKFITDLFKELGNNYRKGFIKCYSIEDAEILGIERPREDISTISSLAELAKNYNNPSLNIIQKKKNHKCKVISFYSYKGGVGRTLALVETAYSLAKKGKKVLILDLDIEAPSFQEIFNDELKNIDLGIVDYLYDKLIDENKIEISDIFEEIKFEDSLDGKLYVVPAGKLSASYVFKLSQLQTKAITENEYLDDLICQLEKRLNIDIVLIDSRTGLNKWGAFSLLDLADNIIYFAYPNRENIFGLKLVIDMMRKANYHKMMIVFSRIEGKASEYSKNLFEHLNYKQEYVPIYYNQDIALANKYPVINALETYAPLTDYILEDQYSSIRRSYLKRKDYTEILLILKNSNKHSIGISINAERKIFDRDTKLVVIPNHMKNYIENRSVLSVRSRRMFSIGATKSGLSYEDIFNDKNKNNYLKDYIKESVNSNLEPLNWKNIWLGYIFYLIKDLNNKKISLNRDLKNCIDEVTKLDETELVYSVNNIINAEFENIDTKDKDSKVEYTKDKYRIIIIISELDWMFKENFEQMDWLKSLIECILMIEELSLTQISISFLVGENNYKENINEFNRFKGNIEYLIWDKSDVKKSIGNYVELLKDNLKDYMYCIKNNIYDDTMLINENNENKKLENMEFDNKKFDDKIEVIRDTTQELIDLFWGIRVDSDKYSKLTFEWFYENLVKYEINDELIVNILEKAIDYQIQEKNNADIDRLISFKSLEQSFNGTFT